MIPTLLTDSITFDLDRAIHYALLWGLEAVELRSVGSPHDRVPFVNERKLRRRLQRSELPILAIVPGLFEGDLSDRAAWLNELATLEETLSFCTRIDCSRVVVSSFRCAGADEGPAYGDEYARSRDAEASLDEIADVLRRAAVKADRSNVRLCVSNGDGGVVRTGAQLAGLLDRIGHPAMTAAWHPDQACMAGENPSLGLDALDRRVGLVRCRNVARIGNGWEARTIDKGAVDWADQIERLHEIDFDGPISLEVRVEPGVANGLREATELIRLIRACR